MPSSLDTPVLQVDANVIHKVDTSNPQNLFSMWTVFARCADNVAQGRRLENLSWRLWTRETFCVEANAPRLSSRIPSSSFPPGPSPSAAMTTAAPKAIPKRQQSTDEVPQLSGSIESAADEDTDDSAEADSEDLLRPRIRRQDSCGSSRSRGRERHITSDDLEKMVVSIVQEKEPLKAPLPDIASFATFVESHISSLVQQTPEASTLSQTETKTESSTVASTPTAEEEQPEELLAEASAKTFPVFDDEDSNDDEEAIDDDETIDDDEEAIDDDEEAIEDSDDEDHRREVCPPPVLQKSKSITEVIIGFSPTRTPIAITESSAPLQVKEEEDVDTIPDPTSEPAAMPVLPKKATFALGGSSSCEDSMSDPSRSIELRGSAIPLPKHKQVHAAAEEGSLKSALHSSRSVLAQKKQASFSNEVMTRTIPAHAMMSDDDQSDSDDNDESAIEDDSSDWEDSNEDSGRSSIDDKTMFQRVDSSVHLPSRRSLITLMIQRSERDVKNGLNTSQSTTGLQRMRNMHQPPMVATSPNDSDGPALMMRHRSRGGPSNLGPINEIPRSAALPIMTKTAVGNYAPALSPRTNRRNMLSTELTESLRRHLLWERQQKTSTANAVLKRRHTSHDVANLRQYPDAVHMSKEGDKKGWDQYLNRDAYNGYHAKGW